MGRHLLRYVAVAWLLCHVVAVMVATFELWPPTNPVACACPYGAVVTCPMHRHQASVGAKPCAMGSTSTMPSPLLTSFLTVAGCLSASTADNVRLPQAPVLAEHVSLVHSFSVPPDSPPPRA